MKCALESYSASEHSMGVLLLLLLLLLFTSIGGSSPYTSNK